MLLRKVLKYSIASGSKDTLFARYQDNIKLIMTQSLRRWRTKHSFTHSIIFRSFSRLCLSSIDGIHEEYRCFRIFLSKQKKEDQWLLGRLENSLKGLSAIPFEEIEVKNRTFYHYGRYELIGRRFRWRMGLSFLPEVAVSENFFDNLFSLDKRDDLHLSTGDISEDRLHKPTLSTPPRSVGISDERLYPAPAFRAA
jgi:hypothetical protein